MPKYENTNVLKTVSFKIDLVSIREYEYARCNNLGDIKKYFNRLILLHEVIAFFLESYNFYHHKSEGEIILNHNFLVFFFFYSVIFRIITPEQYL